MNRARIMYLGKRKIKYSDLGGSGRPNQYRLAIRKNSLVYLIAYTPEQKKVEQYQDWEGTWRKAVGI